MEQIKSNEEKFSKEFLERPLFTLTVREYIGLQSTTPQLPEKKKNHIKGRHELARELGVSVATIYKWEGEKIIKPSKKIGRVIIYDLDEIKSILNM